MGTRVYDTVNFRRCQIGSRHVQYLRDRPGIRLLPPVLAQRAPGGQADAPDGHRRDPQGPQGEVLRPVASRRPQARGLPRAKPATATDSMIPLPVASSSSVHAAPGACPGLHMLSSVLLAKYCADEQDGKANVSHCPQGEEAILKRQSMLVGQKMALHLRHRLAHGDGAVESEPFAPSRPSIQGLRRISIPPANCQACKSPSGRPSLPLQRDRACGVLADIFSIGPSACGVNPSTSRAPHWHTDSTPTPAHHASLASLLRRPQVGAQTHTQATAPSAPRRAQ